MRIDKFLSNSGFGSRKEIKALVKSGAVISDGKAVTDSAMHINENEVVVTVNGERVNYSKYVYLMLNKPAGYVSAVYDKKLPVVTDLVPDKYAHFDVFPVGRLDIDTEGLLILTNDGALSHRLLSPKSHVDKVYFVTSAHKAAKNAEQLFKEGITIDDGYKTMPAELERTDNDTEYLLTLHEGKFHQVKRMFKAIDNEVVYLKRIKMGGLMLDDTLEKGGIRELTPKEITLLEE